MSHELPRVRSRFLFSSALLAATLAVGCGDDGEPTPGFPPVNQGMNPATPGLTGGTTGGLGGPGGLITPPPTTGGTGMQNPKPTTDGGVPMTGGPTTGGSDWCKVKAILDKNCKDCHTTPLAAGAPFPLEKYADLTAASAAKPGKKIYERVAVRVHAAESTTFMPPGRQLAAADLATIDGWVAAGAPQGADATCAGNAPVTPVDEGVWPLPECDAVYKITSKGAGGGEYSVAPGAESHPQISIAAPWGSEKVQAIAFKTITDNKAVLHHWILNGGGAFLTGWAPGEDGVRLMAPDVGMDMPSGTLRLDMHYNSLQATKTETDASGVEICVVKGAKMRKNHAAVTMGLVGIPIIPGNSTNYEIKATCNVSGSSPVTLLSASPHAHTLAVRMLFTVKKKSGQMITMHDMPFMFGEQKSFKLDPPVVVESGDVISTSCFYTNKSSNAVTFGENTGDEMCFNFALYYPAGGLSCGGGGGFLGGDIGAIFGGS